MPGEALDNVAQAYIQKLNRDKPKENKVVGHQLVTDDSGNVRIALTRENGEVETRAFGQIGKKTRPEIPRRVPGAETENQRNLRERQATEARDKIEQQLFDVQAEIDQIGQVLSTRKPTSEERAALEQKKRSLQNKHKLLSRQHAGRFGRTEGAAAPAPTGGKTSASSWEAYKKRFAK